MAKKSFLNENPALAYISKYAEDVQDVQDVQNTQDVDRTQNADYEDKKATSSRKKKTTKSRRVHFLMTPELHKDMLTLAYMERVSLNELVNRLMGEYAASKQDRINMYSTFMEEN